jgi:hypothetical protein
MALDMGLLMLKIFFIRKYLEVFMFRAFLISSLFILGCNSGSTPDAVAINRGCYGTSWSQTCEAVFDDGQRGYTVTLPNGTSYMCKGSALP